MTTGVQNYICAGWAVDASRKSCLPEIPEKQGETALEVQEPKRENLLTTALQLLARFNSKSNYPSASKQGWFVLEDDAGWT